MLYQRKKALRDSNLFIRGSTKMHKWSFLLPSWAVMGIRWWRPCENPRFMLILGNTAHYFLLSSSANCSIQVSEILKHQGNLSEAADLIGKRSHCPTKGTRTSAVFVRLWVTPHVQSFEWNDKIALSVLWESMFLFDSMAPHGKSRTSRVLAHVLGI